MLPDGVLRAALAGRVTDVDGAPIGLQSQSILATNGVLHETLLAELNR